MKGYWKVWVPKGFYPASVFKAPNSVEFDGQCLISRKLPKSVGKLFMDIKLYVCYCIGMKGDMMT